MKILILKSRENLTKFIFLQENPKPNYGPTLLEAKSPYLKKFGKECKNLGAFVTNGIDLDDAVKMVKNSSATLNINTGSKNPGAVIGLESLLTKTGDYKGQIDGVFGPALKDATIQFQKRVRLENPNFVVDGIVGGDTKQVLIAAVMNTSNSTLMVKRTKIQKSSSNLKYAQIMANLKTGIYSKAAINKEYFKRYGEKTIAAIDKYKDKYPDVPPEVILGIAYQESKFNPYYTPETTSADGSTGILRAAKKDIEKEIGRRLKLKNIDDSILGAFVYLNQQIIRVNKNLKKKEQTMSKDEILNMALAAYGGGYRNRNKRQFKNYANAILKHADNLT